jgi:glutaredoxin
LSDFWPHGKVAETFGVLRKEGFNERAIFIIDEKGIIRYIDIHDINNLPDNEVLLNELKKIIPGAEKVIEPLYKDDKDIPKTGVVMYCTPWCGDCRNARAWLKENGISYTEVDISTDLTAARQVRVWCDGSQVTPTFNINGEIIIDFDEPKLAKLLLGK